MMVKHPIRAAMAGAVLVAGAAIAAPSVASASSPMTSASSPAESFGVAQQQLEHQIELRLTQLGRLSADVQGSTTLTATDAGTLAARLSSETASMENLLTQTQAATTKAQLNVIRRTMIKDNRVFAVETPQVFEVIEADAVGAQVTNLEGGEAALQAAVTSLSGQPGYKNAVSHYVAFVNAVNRAGSDSARVSATVIMQLPQDYPGDTKVFVHANHQLLSADVALADASYDQSVIGLAMGGYTGS